MSRFYWTIFYLAYIQTTTIVVKTAQLCNDYNLEVDVFVYTDYVNCREQMYFQRKFLTNVKKLINISYKFMLFDFDKQNYTEISVNLSSYNLLDYCNNKNYRNSRNGKLYFSSNYICIKYIFSNSI